MNWSIYKILSIAGIALINFAIVGHVVYFLSKESPKFKAQFWGEEDTSSNVKENTPPQYMYCSTSDESVKGYAADSTRVGRYANTTTTKSIVKANVGIQNWQNYRASYIDKGVNTIILLPIIRFPADTDAVTLKKIETNQMLMEIVDNTKEYESNITLLRRICREPHMAESGYHIRRQVYQQTLCPANDGFTTQIVINIILNIYIHIHYKQSR